MTNQPQKSHSPTPVQSLDRAFDIIEALASTPHGTSLTNLAQEVSLNKSTVHRILATMISRGYVQQTADSGKYHLTMKFFKIGSYVVGGLDILSASRIYLEQLASQTGHTIHLAVRDGDEIFYLYKEDPLNGILKTSSRVGLHLPMYCTGLGKSILAFLPEKEIEAIWSRSDIKKFTPNTITDCQIFLRQAERIRKCRFAIDDEEHDAGIRCVASPIIDYSGKPVAAVSISASASLLSNAEIENYSGIVKDAAANISKAMGADESAFEFN
ncbi:IclR family transcriptional regulator [Ruminococcus sp. OA3]|uniref:IclR family transcriptional regulator n=1 Tax=Ruminococcus sp. OA3 TaxID=2914164 RepID=UPI001F05ABDE|nr:IclR family transcriptional regulator [Ruminococcus sp. OA3]MCH1982385.1 IclR family transcriptional regulator [Ruminococcus sp. OA3]